MTDTTMRVAYAAILTFAKACRAHAETIEATHPAHGRWHAVADALHVALDHLDGLT